MSLKTHMICITIVHRSRVRTVIKSAYEQSLRLRDDSAVLCRGSIPVDVLDVDFVKAQRA